jgi:hypothetical protein
LRKLKSKRPSFLFEILLELFARFNHVVVQGALNAQGTADQNTHTNPQQTDPSYARFAMPFFNRVERLANVNVLFRSHDGSTTICHSIFVETMKGRGSTALLRNDGALQQNLRRSVGQGDGLATDQRNPIGTHHQQRAAAASMVSMVMADVMVMVVSMAMVMTSLIFFFLKKKKKKKKKGKKQTKKLEAQNLSTFHTDKQFEASMRTNKDARESAKQTSKTEGRKTQICGGRKTALTHVFEVQ